MSILAILGFICSEVAPLLRGPSAKVDGRFAPGGTSRILSAGVDEYRELVQLVTADGHVRFVDAKDGALREDVEIPGLGGRAIEAVQRVGKDQVFLATGEGRMLALRVPIEPRYEGDRRILTPRVLPNGEWTLREGVSPRLFATTPVREGSIAAVFVAGDGPPAVLGVSETRDIFGTATREELRGVLPLRSGEPTAVVIEGGGARALVASSDGFLHAWDLARVDQPVLVDVADVTGSRAVGVTALAYLNGDNSVVVGDQRGRVSIWQRVRDDTQSSGWRLHRMHEFAGHRAPVRAIAVSSRDKGFLTADAAGDLFLRHATSEQTLLRLRADQPVAGLAVSPRANGVVALTDEAQVVHWGIENPHPEITLATLFGRVWYEGYAEPAYVWQSTGGTDDFEPKFSLVPLILGTVKGTLYAMLFALPIAVLAALYTSQFCHPALRSVIKPTVEIMAALPSVVLGFLAGLWFAPLIEDRMPAVAATILLSPLTALSAGCLWYLLPGGLRRRVPGGVEALLLLPLMIGVAYACFCANSLFEQSLFGGDFRAWVQDVLGSRFDQRNCVVVGFAMGVAVVPLIFTISEDALSNVPKRLSSASLALGATSWQTAIRVVLPTASPGIFSAAMVGFGRAVGETMIVLMATGNTPVLDWSVFTGMRTLSANIAVEIPEAPVGSTLYRVLFLAALLLFATTFVINTAAELIRQRLRTRYQQL